MRMHLIVMASVLLSLIAEYGAACDCAPPPATKEALATSVAVFSGKVVHVELKGELNQVTIEVDRVWKGVDAKRVVVFTAADGASCGMTFEPDESYLVYCFRLDDQLSTNRCNRTKNIASAAEDLKELGDSVR